MPPKLSKAEREQLKREEAERKAREEEERRAREEEEEREREERERIEREEAARRQELQDARIAEELNKVKGLQAKWSEGLETWKNDEAAKKEWNDYLSCNKLPLVTDEKALNTWISQYKDTPIIDITTSLEDIQNCLILCGEVERMVTGDGLPAPPEDKLDYYQNIILSMQDIILTKLSLLTHKCSVQADSHIHSETYNMIVEVSLPGELVLCLWGNVAKNPRLKDFSFQERSFSLELPKPLMLADIVISVLYPPFDTLSPLARSFKLEKGGVALAVASPENGEGEEGEEGEGEREGDEAGKGEGEGREVGEGENEGDSTSQAAKDNVNEEENDQQTEVEEEEGGDEREEEEEEGVEGGRVELEEDEVDLRRYRPAGGPIILSILELPAPPKSVGQWMIRKVTGDGPQVFIYPQELSRAIQPTTSNSEKGTETETGVTTSPAIVPGCTQWPPIEITMSLPTPYLFTSEPHMAQWEEESSSWRTNGVKDATFDMQDKTVTFKTYHFAPLAVMADQYCNMPYQSWELTPKGLNHTILRLGGAIMQVVIEIKDRECVLVETSEEESPLSHLTGKPLSARQLLSALKKSGANFDPEQDGHKYCSIPDKVQNSELEESVYQYMAMMAVLFRFHCSCWNRECGRSQYVLQSSEVNSDAADDEGPSGVYVCGERNWKLAVMEGSEQFSLDIADGCEVHGDLYSTLLADSSSEKIPASSPSHMDTLYYWLSHSRPLTYTS